MGLITLDEARAYLMGEDIRSLQDSSQDKNETMTVDEFSSSEKGEALKYASLQAAENALFEAQLDAAFGRFDAASSEDESPCDDESSSVNAQTEQLDEDVTDHEIPCDDGMVGLGVDIVEIERMQGILKRNPTFASKIFSLQEQLYCDAQSNPAAHYAVRFAAKEAVVKALGTGFSHGIGVHDIEVERMKSGRPAVVLTGTARKIAQDQGIIGISLSMSYTKTDAVACAMALTRSVLRANDKRQDPKKVLARQFKETRKILDDL